jgi:hypothetical protein
MRSVSFGEVVMKGDGVRSDRLKLYAAPTIERALFVLVSLLVSVVSVWAAEPAMAREDWRNDDCSSKVVRDERRFIAYIEHTGDGGEDVCLGSRHHDIFRVKGGNDIVRSYDGNDKIHLAGGHDRAYAGAGDDTVWTGGGEDIAYGGAGADFFSERTFREGSDWDCYVAGPGRDNGFIRDGDDSVFDDYWGGKGTHDRYPQIDSFCDDGGSCVQDDVYQVEDGPCQHDPNADCTSPGRPSRVCQNAATKE